MLTQGILFHTERGSIDLSVHYATKAFSKPKHAIDLHMNGSWGFSSPFGYNMLNPGHAFH